MKKNKQKIVRDFTKNDLPHNRKEAFFDVLKLYYPTLIILGVLLFLFFLPALAVIIYRDFSYLKLDSEAENYQTLKQSIDLYSTLFMGIGILIFGLALAGALRVTRIITWHDGLFFTSDFFEGIKLSFARFLLVFFLIFAAHFGLFFLFRYADIDMVWKIVIYSVVVLIFLPLNILLLLMGNIYNAKFGNSLVTGIGLLIKSYPVMLLLTIISGLPFLANLISLIYLKYLVLFVSVVFFTPITLLAWFLISCHYFDLLINKNEYPEIYRKGLVNIDMIKNSLSYSYDRKIYLSPFYKGHISYYETACFVNGEEIKLLYPIKKIISVTNYGLDKQYVEGKDFKVNENGNLELLPGSEIPNLSLDEYYTEHNEILEIPISSDRCKYHFDSQKIIMFGEGDFISKHQITVTYEHDGKWKLTKPKYQGKKLSRFISKLENKENPTFLFYGDSITVGCNASGTEHGGNTKPHMPNFATMVVDELNSVYGVKIKYVNTAVGGMNTDWGVQNVQERACKYNPDLVFIGFGMNDPNLSLVGFIEKIKTIISEIRKTNPDCEFIVCSTTVPNPESTWYDGNQKEYYKEVIKLDMDYVATINMTSMHQDLLKRKPFKDMTGNNINHPNDYLGRIYAQMILGTIIK